MVSRPQNMHGTRIRDSLDKAFLAIAFIAGATGIIGLKQLDIEPWWVAVFAAGVLVSYAAAAWINRNLALEPEVIGDNCYYLGFIFTLISLGVTLYQLAGTGTDASILRDVVAGFGVALASTIVGVFLRVFMMQLRTDIVSRDRQARLELNDASREFRMRLIESVSQMKAFSTEAVQLAGETNTRIHQANEAFHEEHRQLIRETTEQYSTALSDLMAASSAIITRDLKASIEDVLREIRHELMLTVKQMHDAASETSRLRAADAEAQTERIAKAADEARSSHEALMEWNALLRKITKDATHSSRAVQSSAATISDSVSKAIGRVETAATSFDEAMTTLRLGPEMEQAAAALASAAARIDALSRQLERDRTESPSPMDIVAANESAQSGVAPGSESEAARPTLHLGPADVRSAEASQPAPARR